jgi:adenylate kinase
MGELIIMMGPTGAGKGTQGEMLAEELNGVHLSSGSLLRADPKTAPLLLGGRLAPAEEVERVVAEAVDRVPMTQPIVFDGFPRRLSDAQWLEHELIHHGRSLKRVVLIDLDIETSMKRLGLRDRSDDGPEAIRAKWQAYEDETQPVIEYYEKLGVLRRIDGRGTVEEVQQLVKAALS